MAPQQMVKAINHQGSHSTNSIEIGCLAHFAGSRRGRFEERRFDGISQIGEPGEDEVAALVREVLEETGLVVAPDAVGPLQWTQESTFEFRSVRRWSRCHGRVVRLPDPGAAAAPVLTSVPFASMNSIRVEASRLPSRSTEALAVKRGPMAGRR